MQWGLGGGNGYTWPKSHFAILALEDLFQCVSWPRTDYYQARGLSPRGQRDHLCVFFSLRGGMGGNEQRLNTPENSSCFLYWPQDLTANSRQRSGVTKQNRNLLSGDLKNLVQERNMNQGGSNRWAHFFDHIVLDGGRCYKRNMAKGSATTGGRHSCHHHWKSCLSWEQGNFEWKIRISRRL